MMRAVSCSATPIISCPAHNSRAPPTTQGIMQVVAPVHVQRQRHDTNGACNDHATPVGFNHDDSAQMKVCITSLHSFSALNGRCRLS